MTIYGRTWWGKKWLQCLGGVDCDNRLQRGEPMPMMGESLVLKLIVM